MLRTRHIRLTFEQTLAIILNVMRSRGEKVDNKKKIRDAAASLFKDKGYAGTSMRDIGTRCGMNQGSIYYHFTSKQDILLDVLRVPMSETVGQMTQISHSNLSWLEKIRKAFFLHIAAYDLYYPAAFVAFALPIDVGTGVMDELNHLWNRYTKLWMEILEQGVAEGQIRHDIDLNVALFALFGMCNWMYKWYKPTGERTTEEIAEIFCGIFVRGIAPSVQV